MTPADTLGKKIRVLVVDDIPETRENVKKLLFFEDDIEIVGTAANGGEGVEMTGKLLPDIVLMDINMPEMDGITATEAIVNQYHTVQVIMMSVQGEADYLRRSMLAGAREFLVKPFSGEELAGSMRRVYELGASRRAVSPAGHIPAGVPHLPPEKGGKIIVVFGAKGGCGASTLAVNLAVALRQETKERIALVDANLEMGDIGVLLNLPGHRSIADISNSAVDEEMINGALASHGSGIKALLAPSRPEMAELVSGDLFKTMLHLLSRMFDYIVIDLWRTFQEPTVTLMDAADKIILLTTSDIPSVKNAKLFFELTHALGYPPEKCYLVLNREDGRSTISVKDIESSIKRPVMAVLPRDDRTTLLALNRGTPFVTAAPTIPLTLSILALARSLRRAPENGTAAIPSSAAVTPGKLKWFSRK